MSLLVDTNVMWRVLEPTDPAFTAITNTLKAIDVRGETVYITAQNLIEFRSVATRPRDVNGLGMSAVDASVVARRIESTFPLLPDAPAILPHWRNLVDTYGVIGRQVHDTRLVAVVLTYGLTGIVTLNTRHFDLYGGITVVEPK
jgi:predicted nucleic acid-binding protein